MLDGSIQQDMCRDGLEDLKRDAVRTEPSLPDRDYFIMSEPPDAQGYSASYRRLSPFKDRAKMMRLLHAAMGLCTEAGEFMDQLKKHIFYGKPLDETNLFEELGDSSWYERIALDALEQKYLDMLERNVAKLRARFPDKFKESDAITRDLDKERQALEERK